MTWPIPQLGADGERVADGEIERLVFAMVFARAIGDAPNMPDTAVVLAQRAVKALRRARHEYMRSAGGEP